MIAFAKAGVPGRLSNGTNRGSAGPTLRRPPQSSAELHNFVKSINKPIICYIKFTDPVAGTSGPCRWGLTKGVPWSPATLLLREPGGGPWPTLPPKNE